MEETITLSNGIEMPKIGYGTYLTPPEKTRQLVLQALKHGYRLIDTAQNYGNEKQVGQAIRESGIKREEIFVTSKTQTSGYQSTKRGIERSLKETGLDYIDLMIIHWPNQDNAGTYRALEEAFKEGKVRSIGLSNFNQEQTQKILDLAEIKPVINQIETHMSWQQEKMHRFLKDRGIVHESWSPFAEGADRIFENPVIQRIARKYKKSPAQIILRYLMDNDIVVIPKTTRESRMEENLNIFDFCLDEEDQRLLRSLDQGRSLFNWPAAMAREEYPKRNRNRN